MPRKVGSKDKKPRKKRANLKVKAVAIDFNSNSASIAYKRTKIGG